MSQKNQVNQTKFRFVEGEEHKSFVYPGGFVCLFEWLLLDYWLVGGVFGGERGKSRRDKAVKSSHNPCTRRLPGNLSFVLDVEFGDI